MIATVNGNNTRAVCSKGIPSGDGGARLRRQRFLFSFLHLSF